MGFGKEQLFSLRALSSLEVMGPCQAPWPLWRHLGLPY